MATHTFLSIDGHTCGNPVRIVAGGAPALHGATMIEKRAHLQPEFDWVRTALMLEPRGHEQSPPGAQAQKDRRGHNSP